LYSRGPWNDEILMFFFLDSTGINCVPSIDTPARPNRLEQNCQRARLLAKLFSSFLGILSFLICYVTCCTICLYYLIHQK